METLTDPKDPLGILKKKNGQAKTEETPSEGDPLGILKKKEPTVSEASSRDGFTGLMPASSTGASPKQSEPLEKSGENPAQDEFNEWANSRAKELQDSLSVQLKNEEATKRDALDKELRSLGHQPGSKEWVDNVNKFEKQIYEDNVRRIKELEKAYTESFQFDQDKKIKEINEKYSSVSTSQPPAKPIRKLKAIPAGPYGMTSPLGRSFINFFVNAAPKTIYREALDNMPKNYEELLEKSEQGPTSAEDEGFLTMDRIKSTPLPELLAEYKERSKEEPGHWFRANKNVAAKTTYDILLRASKTSNPTPERVMAFYKDEINRLIKNSREKFEKEKIEGAEKRESALIGGIPQDFTSIKSAKEFKDWLSGSVGQGIASSIAFATSPAILFKMERYDALDEIRSKKAESLTEKFGTEITPKSLEKIQSKEENEADENLANTVGIISMGLEGLGFLAGAGKAAKQLFFGSAKKKLLEQATKYGTKGALKDIGIAGGGEFATEYLQDIDQQVGALVATGMSLTEAMANVNHERAFNAGMQGLAPGVVFGSVTATSKFNENKPTAEVIKDETKEVDPNNVAALDTSAKNIQAKVEASEQEVINPEKNETIQTQTEEAGTTGAPTTELPETSTAEDTQKKAEKTDVQEGLTPEILQVGITAATEKVPEIKTLMEQGREFESKGDFKERDRVFGEILDIGERVINEKLSKVEGAKITLDRTVGNFFSYSEPTFVATMEFPSEKRSEAITSIVDSAESLAQENVHISEITPLSDEVVLGEEMEDGSINEPNVDIRFEQPLTGFAGFTINPDKKGINLYNVSKFESHDKFIEKLGKVKEILDGKGIPYTAQESVRKLFNYGNPEYGATRSYQQVRDQNDREKVNEETIQNDSKKQGVDKEPVTSGKDVPQKAGQVAPSETKKAVPEKTPPPKERKFATQVLEDPNVSKEVKQGLSEDAKNYVPKGIKITDQEAKAIIEVKGPEQAMADYLDRTNEIAEDTRAVLGQNLIRHFNQIQDFDNAVKVADNLAKWYTDLGRAVNAGKVFQLLTPEGVLRYVSKEITKAKADYSKKTTGKRRQSKDAVDFINKQAVEKVLSNPKIKNRITSEVKKGRIKQAIDFLETLKIDTKGKALDVTYGLTAGAWNTLITAVQKGLEAGLMLSQAINKAMAKTKKDVKQFDEAGASAFLSDKLKDYRVTLDPGLAIKEELRAQNDKIDNIIREHYTVVDEKKRSLVDKLVKDANLDEDTAKVVAQDLSKEFDRLTKEAKERALKKYLPKEKKPNKASRKDLIDTIIEASNLGALSDEQYKDVISEKIGVKSITAEEAKKITGLADKVQKAKEGFDKSRATQTLLDYISTIEGYSAIDIGMSIWYANILSGLSTQVLNLSANFTETMGEAYITAVHNPKEFGWIMKGLFSGWGRGFLEAMDTIQHGFQPTKFEQKITTSPILERVTFKGGPWNPYNYLKYVTRLMNAADIFFYQGINEMRSRELAVKTAKKEGKTKPDKSVIKKAKELIYKGEKPWEDALESAKAEGWTGRDLKRRAYEILEQQRPEFLIKDSNDASARGTFNYDPEGTLGALTSAVNFASERVSIGGVKPIKFIIPFTRIISNVANRYLDWTPVGLLRAAKGGIGFQSLGENLHREYTPEERAKVFTKAMTGIVGFTALFALTDEDDGPFEITADGTGDIFKNYELQETGWRPYSIKINGTWYEYKNTPLAIPMATLGYLRDLEKYRGEKDIEAKTSIVLFGTMKYIMDLSFLQSLSAFFDTFSKDNTSSADSFFKKSVKRTESTVKSFVIPNAFTQVSRSVQEVMDLPIKRANGFGDQIIRDLPILRDRLGNIYDALGDPVVPNQTERFLPLKPSKSTEEKDKLWTLIADNGAWIGRPGRGTLKPNGEGLTDDEYDEFSLLAGKLTKQKLLLNYYYLSQIKDKQEVKEEIGTLKREARKEARDTLFGFDIF